MNRLCQRLLIGCAIIALQVLGVAAPSALEIAGTMVVVPAACSEPLIRTTKDAPQIAVAAFLLDVTAVTNAEFLAFVKANPKWRRSEGSPLFADSSFLVNWTADLEPGLQAPPGAPVVQISWFAARAYARWVGERLPSTAEW